VLGVKAVEDLQAYVNACKAALASASSAEAMRRDFEDFDLWFEICTGQTIEPSPHDPPPPAAEAEVEELGALSVHRGRRRELEEELVRLIVLDGDSARMDEICALLDRRADGLQVVRSGAED
jgi:hypothetical protein